MEGEILLVGFRNNNLPRSQTHLQNFLGVHQLLMVTDATVPGLAMGSLLHG